MQLIAWEMNCVWLLVESQCAGRSVLNSDNNMCYTYYSTAKTRQDAADSCLAARSQLVSVQVSFTSLCFSLLLQTWPAWGTGLFWQSVTKLVRPPDHSGWMNESDELSVLPLSFLTLLFIPTVYSLMYCESMTTTNTDKSSNVCV